MKMKNYGSCMYCGKIDHLTNELCEDCFTEEMDNVKKIKEILAKHPNSNAMEIAQKTNISIDRITRLIKRGTLI
ncbi:hypothetical protein ACDX78_19110 [Virgibacillus oceani]